MIDRLHAAALIDRRYDASDRRRIILRITGAGRKLITPLLP
jgi:DNA-binding MarR family transcriptional regulator